MGLSFALVNNKGLFILFIVQRESRGTGEVRSKCAELSALNDGSVYLSPYGTVQAPRAFQPEFSVPATLPAAV